MRTVIRRPLTCSPALFAAARRTCLLGTYVLGISVLGISFTEHRVAAQDAGAEADEADEPVAPPARAAIIRRRAAAGFRPAMVQDEDVRREQYQQQLALVIDEMQRVCKLSDDQVSKLQTASKGAVDKAMGTWKQRMKEMQVQVQQNGGRLRIVDEPAAVEPDADNELPADVEPVEDDQSADGAPNRDEEPQGPGRILAAPLRIANAAVPFEFAPTAAVDPSHEDVWKKAVQRVLSDQQRQQYEKSLEVRRAFARQAAVQQLISQIDADLLLSDEQRKSMSQLLEETMGPQLEETRMQPAWIGMPTTLPLFVVARQLPAEKVDKILSKAQRNRWEQHKEAMQGGVFVAPQVLRE